MSGRGGRLHFGQNCAAKPNTEQEFPFTEPLIVPSPHVDGLVPHSLAGIVHFVGWHLTPPMSESVPGERRIMLRFAMGEFEARALRYALGWALGEGH